MSPYPLPSSGIIARKVANYASANNIPVGICCQLNPSDEHVTDISKVFHYGVIADVVQVLDLPGGGHTALVRARGKFKIIGASEGNSIPGSELNVMAKPVADKLSESPDKQFEVLLDSIRQACKQISSVSDGNPAFMLTIDGLTHPAELVNTIATNLPIDPAAKNETVGRQHGETTRFQAVSSIAAINRQPGTCE